MIAYDCMVFSLAVLVLVFSLVWLSVAMWLALPHCTCGGGGGQAKEAGWWVEVVLEAIHQSWCRFQQMLPTHIPRGTLRINPKKPFKTLGNEESSFCDHSLLLAFSWAIHHLPLPSKIVSPELPSPAVHPPTAPCDSCAPEASLRGESCRMVSSARDALWDSWRRIRRWSCAHVTLTVNAVEVVFLLKFLLLVAGVLVVNVLFWCWLVVAATLVSCWFLVVVNR